MHRVLPCGAVARTADKIAHTAPDRGRGAAILPKPNLIVDPDIGQPRLGVGAPQAGISGIGQGQRAGSGKHRHRFVHRVDHRAAGVDFRPEPAGQQHLGADVLEQERHRAVRVRPSGNAVGLAIRQIPVFAVCAILGRRFQRREFLAPRHVILGFGQHPRLAQFIQHHVDLRPP